MQALCSRPNILTRLGPLRSSLRRCLLSLSPSSLSPSLLAVAAAADDDDEPAAAVASESLSPSASSLNDSRSRIESRAACDCLISTTQEQLRFRRKTDNTTHIFGRSGEAQRRGRRLESDDGAAQDADLQVRARFAILLGLLQTLLLGLERRIVPFLLVLIEPS